MRVYRGKTPAGKWVYGFYIHFVNYHCILEIDHLIRSNNFVSVYLDPETGCIDGYATPVMPGTVGLNMSTLYTVKELPDGDSEHTFIYENDICKVTRAGATLIGVVEIYNGAFGLRFKSGEFNSFLYLKRSRPDGCWFDTLEVIGNIHDNPELLEVGE